MKTELLKPTALAAAIALVGTAGVGTIKHFEGLEQRPYIDAVGIRTVCYGHTGQFVRGNHIRTVAECEEILGHDILVHARGVQRCLRREPTRNQMAAMTSLAFNVGVPTFCRSTLVRKFNAGDTRGAAAEFGRWKYARVNGRMEVLRGLERRRQAEMELFLRR
jgi:lysozyme